MSNPLGLANSGRQRLQGIGDRCHYQMLWQRLSEPLVILQSHDSLAVLLSPVAPGTFLGVRHGSAKPTLRSLRSGLQPRLSRAVAKRLYHRSHTYGLMNTGGYQLCAACCRHLPSCPFMGPLKSLERLVQ